MKKKRVVAKVNSSSSAYFGLFRQSDFRVCACLSPCVAGRRWSNKKKKLSTWLSPSLPSIRSSSLPQNERGHIRSAMAPRKLCHPQAGMSPGLPSAICRSYWLPVPRSFCPPHRTMQQDFSYLSTAHIHLCKTRCLSRCPSEHGFSWEKVSQLFFFFLFLHFSQM